ncbi:MAG TPA: flagellar biosynthetic protein FliO [Opitutaceae bacterium]|jgi:flagellar protein FliO/FliZ
MSRFWRGLGFGLLLVAAAPGHAESPSAAGSLDNNTVLVPRADSAHAAPGATVGWSGGMITFFVLVLGGAGAWMLWQRNRGGSAGLSRGLGGGHGLQVSETKSLGNRQFLIVASYGERKFLLGVCPGRIDLLAPLDPSAPAASAADRR